MYAKHIWKHVLNICAFTSPINSLIFPYHLNHPRRHLQAWSCVDPCADTLLLAVAEQNLEKVVSNLWGLICRTRRDDFASI